MARILMIVPPERFRDEELFDTRAVLLEAGHGVTVGRTKLGSCPGSRGRCVDSITDIATEHAADWDAVVFVGGGGARLLWNDPNALRIAQEATAAGTVLGAICLAPVTLANAGVLDGKRATVAGTEARTIEGRGATYTGPGVTVDGLVVTANAPKASAAFGAAIADLLV